MARTQLILDRYELLGTAGAGGFGTVQVAWDPRIQRKVAIKTIMLSEAEAIRAKLPGANAAVRSTSEQASRWRGVQPWNEYLKEDSPEEYSEFESETALEYESASEYKTESELESDEPAVGSVVPETFLAHVPGLDEARTAAKLQDTRIVSVFDFEVREQRAYLIMEYIEGITLTRFLAEYEDYLSLDVVAALFDAVAGALTVAHKAGVLHLDIKPDNILINAEGQAKVTDFGLATLADAAGTGLAGGGTIGYMPLEQMRREPLDARTDEWSLAAVTYEMLTGDNPFRGASNLAEAETAIEDAELILPSLCWEQLDEQMDDVIFYALDPNREERYASVSDFAEEADKFLGDAERGKRLLAAVVTDALGLWPREEDADYADYADYEDFVADEAELTSDNMEYRKRDGWSARKARFGKGFNSPRKPRNLFRDTRQNMRIVGRALTAIACFFALWMCLPELTPYVSLVGLDNLSFACLLCGLVAAIISLALPCLAVSLVALVLAFSLIADAALLPGIILAFGALVGGASLYTLGSSAARPSPVWALLLGCALAAGIVALVALAPTPPALRVPLYILAASFVSCALVSAFPKET